MFLKYIRFNGLSAIADTPSPTIIPLNRGPTVGNYAVCSRLALDLALIQLLLCQCHYFTLEVTSTALFVGCLSSLSIEIVEVITTCY
jgi:hypothetical protein